MTDDRPSLQCLSWPWTPKQGKGCPRRKDTTRTPNGVRLSAEARLPAAACWIPRRRLGRSRPRRGVVSGADPGTEASAHPAGTTPIGRRQDGADARDAGRRRRGPRSCGTWLLVQTLLGVGRKPCHASMTAQGVVPRRTERNGHDIALSGTRVAVTGPVHRALAGRNRLGTAPTARSASAGDFVLRQRHGVRRRQRARRACRRR